ncbi:MAG TPA: hypothetical protein VGZ25_00165 [Gemmataceae bacterium]|nr:hypothetical protein [Gemmataceae bacterium]
MIRHLCPTCDLVIQSADSLAGLPIRCPHCHISVTVPKETIHNPKTDESGFYATVKETHHIPDPRHRHHPLDSRRMAKWRNRLKEYYKDVDDFSVLVPGEERSGRMGSFLAPILSSYYNKPCLVGYRFTDHTLCLFPYRRSMWLRRFSGFLDTEEVPLNHGTRIKFHAHRVPLMTSLDFRDSTGKTRHVFFALPTFRDSKALHQAIHEWEASEALEKIQA